MKKVVVVVFALFGFSLSAQDAIDKYFSDLESDTALTKVTVSGKMFELFQHMEAETEEEKEFIEAVSKLNSMRVLVKENAPDGKSLFNSANSKVGKEFETLLTVDREGERFNFLIKEKNGVISEFLMIGLGGTQKEDFKFIVISITGEIDLAQISKLSRAMNVKELEHLDHVEDK